MHLNNSTVKIDKRPALIKGEIMNNSTLIYKSAGEIVLKQDETIVIQVNR